MSLEELDQLRLLLPADAFEFEDFLEVAVRPIPDVDQIRLHKTFGWDRLHLKRLKQWIQLLHALVDPFDVTITKSHPAQSIARVL